MNNDKKNLDELFAHYGDVDRFVNDLDYSDAYPLDSEVRDTLREIVLQDNDDDFKIFTYMGRI